MLLRRAGELKPLLTQQKLLTPSVVGAAHHPCHEPKRSRLGFSAASKHLNGLFGISSGFLG